jgi:branched-chain amino acid transport system ATP-binding protein
VKLLKVDNITKRFGGLVAVNGLDFNLHVGEILGLVGQNGAGKTTVFNMITGAFGPSHGDIFFEGKRITGLKPNRIARLGAVRTFQLTNLFMDMTVMQNIILGTHHNSGIGSFQFLSSRKRIRESESIAREQATKLLDFMDLSDQMDALAKNLPHGQQRRLEMSVALAAQPKLLLLDEPLQGMNQDEVRDMLARIEKIRSGGTSILLVEHNMKAVTNICDRVVVLDFGRKLDEGPPVTVMKNKAVIEAYLGIEE